MSVLQVVWIAWKNCEKKQIVCLLHEIKIDFCSFAILAERKSSNQNVILFTNETDMCTQDLCESMGNPRLFTSARNSKLIRYLNLPWVRVTLLSEKNCETCHIKYLWRLCVLLITWLTMNFKGKGGGAEFRSPFVIIRSLSWYVFVFAQLMVVAEVVMMMIMTWSQSRFSFVYLLSFDDRLDSDYWFGLTGQQCASCLWNAGLIIILHRLSILYAKKCCFVVCSIFNSLGK